MRAEAGTLVLGVDAATGRRSVAVARGRAVLSLVAAEAGAPASGALVEIDAALREASLGAGDIELFAVASGPGSFTGLRSGLATVKALAATLDRPVVGVPTLHAVAHAARPAARVIPMIPAGRGEVFAQLLCAAGADDFRELEPPAHLPPSALIERAGGLGGGLAWAGSGAHLFAEEIRAAAAVAGIPFVILPQGEGVELAGELAEELNGAWALAPPVEVLAPSVARLALARHQAGRATTAQDLRALYVRASDAELKERWLKHAQLP